VVVLLLLLLVVCISVLLRVIGFRASPYIQDGGCTVA